MPYITEWEPCPDLECHNCGEQRVRRRDWQADAPPPDDVDTCYSCDACRDLWWSGTDADPVS